MNATLAHNGFSASAERSISNDKVINAEVNSGLHPVAYFLWIYTVIFSTILATVLVAEYFFMR